MVDPISEREEEKNPGRSEPEQDLLEHFNDTRLRKLYHYIVYEVTEEDVIKERVAKESAPTEITSQNMYELFVNSLPEADCRYIVFDYRYISDDDALLNKLIFIIWCPDNTNDLIKSRFHNAKSVLRKKLSGIEYELYATQYEDFAFEEFKELIGVP